MKIEMKYVIEECSREEYWFISTPVFKKRYKFIQNNICQGDYFLNNKHKTIGSVEYINGTKITRNFASWKDLRKISKIKILRVELKKLIDETFVNFPR